MSRMALKLSCACASLSHLRASVALSPISCLKISSTDRASTISCHIPSLSVQRPGPSWRSSFALCRAASNTTLAAENECERLIQHLLVPEEKLSLVIELQRQAQQGSDLGDLAVEHSICPSKNDGGMLGWIRKGQLVPEFEEAAFSAPLNKVVRVKTKFGWHLLQALSERDAAFLHDMQPEELQRLLQDPNFCEVAQLIDVRELDEIEIASIKGFKAYPLSQFGLWGPQISSDLDPSKDTYVLCHHGVRSLQAAQWLQTQGFRKLYNIAGGIHQYSLRADNSIRTY